MVVDCKRKVYCCCCYWRRQSCFTSISAHNMDDWKLSAVTVVKLENELNVFVLL